MKHGIHKRSVMSIAIETFFNNCTKVNTHFKPFPEIYAQDAFCKLAFKKKLAFRFEEWLCYFHHADLMFLHLSNSTEYQLLWNLLLLRKAVGIMLIHMSTVWRVRVSKQPRRHLSSSCICQPNNTWVLGAQMWIKRGEKGSHYSTSQCRGSRDHLSNMAYPKARYEYGL